MIVKCDNNEKDNFYAEEIEYKELINAISKVGEIFDN